MSDSVYTPVRIGFCGLGQWGPNLLRNLRENPNARVVALCDSDEKRLVEFQALHPDARVTRLINDIVSADDIDAVVIATPAGLHEEHVALCLENGKDVLVEKPLALSLEAATRLVNQATSLGRILMVGHTFLFNTAVRQVRQTIADGDLGKLQFIHAQRLSLGRVRQDCNALWNLAPHDISILLHWIGAMPVSVSARGIAFNERHAQEDIALCILEFPGPVLASIQVSWLNPVKVRQMTVVGSERMLVYDDVKTEQPLTLYDQGVREEANADPSGSLDSFRLVVRQGPKAPIPVEWKEPLSEEISHFLECVYTRRQPTGSGREALQIMSVLEACDRSIKQQGKPVVPEITWA